MVAKFSQVFGGLARRTAEDRSLSRTFELAFGELFRNLELTEILFVDIH